MVGFGKILDLHDDMKRFFLFAMQGKVHESTGCGSESELDCEMLKTPVSRGLQEGYLHTDIACFYIARELGNDWVSQIIENLNDDFLRKITKAHQGYVDDVVTEIKSIKR